ncbi:MAG TPA: hypothetical protein VJ894_09645, partial [Cryomorphaceae bacterium]|nr:hypothetical protein [Cryomorphaceae bacterium]
MKNLFTVGFFLLGLVAFGQSSSEELTRSIDHLLSSFVKKGKVDYKTIHSVQSDLDRLASEIERFPIASITAEKEKAFLINAYNIFVIKQVVDHYPITSPQEVGNF